MSRKVMIVSHEASRTGAPKVAGHLLGALRDGGWETVLVHRWGGPLRAELDRMADRSLDEPAARLRVALRRRPGTKGWGARVERWAVRRTLRAVRPDLVWCNTVVTSPYAVEAVATGIPVVLFSHEQPKLVGEAFDRSGLGRPGGTSIDGVTLAACATETARGLAAELGCDLSAVEVLNSPVDVATLQAVAEAAPDPYGADRRAGVVVACGTGDLRKGIDTFVAAAAAAPDVRWVWVGRVDEANRRPAAEFPGEQETASGWLAAADVVVLPSRGDTFPLVVLEAMALGKPVVASDTEGPREQLGDAGVFVPVADAEALAAAVTALLSAPARARELGEQARARCERLWDVGPFGEHVRAISDAAVSRSPGVVGTGRGTRAAGPTPARRRA